MKRIALLLIALMSFAQARSQDDAVRVDPPFWWTSMENKELQLLVHHPGIAQFVPKLQYEGVKLKNFTALESPNYLVINLEVAPNTKPGTFTITFIKGLQSFTYPYQLKARMAMLDRVQGISADDVMYLIMPDRFANGDPSNDVVPGMTQTKLDRAQMYERHGGDLKGIQNHLNYLKDLGITALWLNPVFENNQPATSYHGYAITDHYKVDPRLGTNDEYAKLVEAAHKNGIKMVNDVIYNHIGSEHYLFKDLPARDWINQWDSFTRTSYREPVLFDPYASQYDINKMSNGWFDKHMPDLNQRNPLMAKYLIQNAIWWVEEFGLDAYRIDTYAYPDQKFMSEFCSALLAEYPQLGIFGETWVHGPAVQSFFMENNVKFNLKSTLPGVTDFQMYFAISEALTRDQGWTEGVSKLYYTLSQDFLYKDPFKNVLFLDNHDLSRFYSVIGEDFNKFKQGIALLMTMRGIPCLYYGTEILMKNFSDPDGKVREDFPGGWKGDARDKFMPEGRTEKEQKAFEYVRDFAKIRHAIPTLNFGKTMQFIPEDGVYVYFRYDDYHTIMVVLNTSKDARTINLNRFHERTVKYTKARNVFKGGPGIPYINEKAFKVAGTSVEVYELE